MKNNTALKSIMAILAGILAGGILMLAMGFNPFEAYGYIFQGGLMDIKKVGDTIGTATPLILTGLSVAFAFRTGLFNIGAPGQMLFGGFCATAVGLSFDLPQIIIVPLMVITAILAGALWAAVPGLLKALFNVHEVVSSIMMNWIAYWVVFYGIKSYFTDGVIATQTKNLPSSATLKVKWLTDMFDGSRSINLGIFLALIAVIVIWFILNKTVLGYELKAVGFNKFGAEYAGMPVNRNIVISMMIAGALAGLAGVVQYAGISEAMKIGVMPAQGFDGIAISLLGANTPIGVLLAALFFALLTVGSGFMKSWMEIDPEIVNTIIAIIMYFAATSVLMDKVIKRFKRVNKDNDSKFAKSEERVVEK